MRNGQKLAMLKKSCKFVKNKLFSIRIIHAHLKYIWNKCAKNSNETMKALGLDFIKYALPAVLYISDGWNMSKLKNAVNLSKIIFSPIKFFMHILNMSVTCLQSIEKNY